MTKVAGNNRVLPIYLDPQKALGEVLLVLNGELVPGMALNVSGILPRTEVLRMVLSLWQLCLIFMVPYKSPIRHSPLVPPLLSQHINTSWTCWLLGTFGLTVLTPGYPLNWYSVLWRGYSVFYQGSCA